jgi:hypothetical protein
MKTPRKVLASQGGLLWLFISERAFGRYKGRVVNCNTGAVSRIRIEINSHYY